MRSEEAPTADAIIVKPDVTFITAQAAQAARGKAVDDANCRSCPGPT